MEPDIPTTDLFRRSREEMVCERWGLSTGEVMSNPQPIGEKLKKKSYGIRAGLKWNAFSQTATSLIRLLTMLASYSVLPTDAVGLMAMVGTVTGFGYKLKDFGTWNSVVQREEMSPTFLNGAFFVNLAVGVVIAVTIILLSAPVANFYNSAELDQVLLILALIFMIQPLSQVNRALLGREMRFDVLAVVGLAAAFSSAVVTIAGVFSGFGIWGLVAGEVTSSIVMTLGAWFARPWKPGLSMRKDELREVFFFGKNLIGFNLINYGFENADRILIGRILGAESLGIYAFAQRVVLLPVTTLAAVLGGVMISSFSRIQRDDASIKEKFTRAMVGVAAVVFPALVGFACVARDFFALYDERWSAAAMVITLATPAGLAQALLKNNGAVFVSKGRPDLLLRLGIALGGWTVICYAVGVRFGILGVAAGYSFAMLTGFVPSMSITFRMLGGGMGVLLKRLLPILVACAALLLAVLTANGLMAPLSVEMRFPVAVVMGGAVYGVVLLLLARRVVHDLLSLVRG